MSTTIQHRRGTTAEHASFTGAVGEVTYNTTTKSVHTHDGVTAGGFPLIKASDLSADTGAGLVGYLPAGTGAVARTVQGKFGDSINLFDVIPVSEHAAIRAGTSTYDAQPKIQALIDELSAAGVARTIIGNSGKYICGDTVTLKSPISLVGESVEFNLVFNDITKDGFVIAGGATGERWRTVSNLTASGLARDMFVCAPTPVANLRGLHLDVNNVIVNCSGGVNGFVFANMYASSFRNLGGYGGVSNAKFKILATVNGVSIDNLYTTGVHLYSIYYNSLDNLGSNLPMASTVQFNSPVLQGGNYGMYIAGCFGLVINNPYFENVANNMVFGANSDLRVRGVVVNGGTYGGSFVGNPYHANRGPIFRFDGAHGVIINTPTLFNPVNFIGVGVSGGGGGGAEVLMLINKDGSPAAYVVSFCGGGYTTAPTLTAPTPTSGTAETLTPVIRNGKLEGITASGGSNPKYTTGIDSFPVVAMIGGTSNNIVINTPCTLYRAGRLSLHNLLGRSASALSVACISVVNDHHENYGTTINTGKTAAYGWQQYHSFIDNTGVQQVWLSVLPLIQEQ